MALIAEAGQRGVRLLCLPEAILPGHRMQKERIAEVSAAAIDAALAEVGRAARAAGVATLVGTERPTPSGRHLTQVVFDEKGENLGEQLKTQVDPREEELYAPGARRRTFKAAGVTFGVALCHEVFRYPEIPRALALAGAQIVFAPHYVTTKDGYLPKRWLDPDGPYNEKALMCRAVENTVFVAAANIASPDQGSASCIIAPDGSLLASVPYGKPGLAVADIDLTRATGLIARRWAPERSLAS